MAQVINSNGLLSLLSLLLFMLLLLSTGPGSRGVVGNLLGSFSGVSEKHFGNEWPLSVYNFISNLSAHVHVCMCFCYNCVCVCVLMSDT